MVGQRIKAYLAEHGIKQAFLVEKTDIPSSALTQMLSGNRKIEVMEYYRICKALKVDVNMFLSDDETSV
jgi:Helix-turn-helix.